MHTKRDVGNKAVAILESEAVPDLVNRTPPLDFDDANHQMHVFVSLFAVGNIGHAIECNDQIPSRQLLESTRASNSTGLFLLTPR